MQDDIGVRLGNEQILILFRRYSFGLFIVDQGQVISLNPSKKIFGQHQLWMDSKVNESSEEDSTRKRGQRNRRVDARLGVKRTQQLHILHSASNRTRDKGET